MIRALAEAGIRVDYVAGTSIGALVGAVYASGEIDSLEEVVLQLDWKEIAYLFDVVLPIIFSAISISAWWAALI